MILTAEAVGTTCVMRNQLCRAGPYIPVHAFFPAGKGQHDHVEHFAGVRRVPARKSHSDDMQSAVRRHRAAAVAEDRQTLGLGPVVDDMRQQIDAMGGGNAVE